MSGVTVPLGFPYPTDADFVTLGDEAIQALAEAVDDYFVGVTSVAVAAGGSVTLNGTRVHRRGRVGILNCENLAATALLGVGNTILTLPVGYRPAVSTRGVIVVYVAGGNTTIMVELQAGGAVVIANAIPNGAAVYGSVTFPL